MPSKMSTPRTTGPSSVSYKQIRALYDETTITVYQAYSGEIATAAVAAQRLNASPKFLVDSRMTWIKPSWGWMLYRAGYSFKDKRQERILALRMRKGDFLGLLRGAVLTTHASALAPVSAATPAAAAAAAAGESESGTVVSTGESTVTDTGTGSKESAEEDLGTPAPVSVSGRGNGNGGEAGTGTADGSQRRFKGPGRGRTGRRDNLKEERPKSSSVKIQWDPERSVRLERLNYRSIQIGIPGCMTKQWCEEMIVGIEDVTDKARELKRVLDADAEHKIGLEELINMGLVPLEREFEVPGDIRRVLGMDSLGGEPELGEDRE